MWLELVDQLYFAQEIAAWSVLLIVVTVNRSVVLFPGDCSRVNFTNCDCC